VWISGIAVEGFACAAPATGDESAFLFTSGATGPAKGIDYMHGEFAAQRASLRELYAWLVAPMAASCSARTPA